MLTPEEHKFCIHRDWLKISFYKSTKELGLLGNKFSKEKTKKKKEKRCTDKRITEKRVATGFYMQNVIWVDLRKFSGIRKHLPMILGPSAWFTVVSKPDHGYGSQKWVMNSLWTAIVSIKWSIKPHTQNCILKRL